MRKPPKKRMNRSYRSNKSATIRGFKIQITPTGTVYLCGSGFRRMESLATKHFLQVVLPNDEIVKLVLNKDGNIVEMDPV